MKYQLGDTVLLLHSNEEAIITEFLNNEMMMVDVDGVSFPVYMDQVDFPYFKRFTEKKEAKKEKTYIDDIRKEKNSSSERTEEGVFISFLPVIETLEYGEDVLIKLKINLVNQTASDFHFVYKLHFFGKPDFELKNEMRPFEHFYLNDISFDDLNDSPSFEFEFSLLPPDKSKADHFSTTYRIKPKKLFEKLKELKEKNLASFSSLLFEHYPDKIHEVKPELSEKAKKGSKLYEASKARQHLEPARSVVDLHVEKLTDDWPKLSNYEILGLQLKTFEKYYELAIAHVQPSLIVIHGVGEGKLRGEIHEILRTKKEVKSFVNQYHPLYGYGATEIYF